MKQLLLLPLLCLMPAAHAVDYVQCEAMQKAVTRLEGSYDKLFEEWSKMDKCKIFRNLPKDHPPDLLAIAEKNLKNAKKN